MSELEELKQDLIEIQQVLTTIKRKGNVEYLNNRIKYLENSIKILTPQKVEQPIQVQKQEQQQDKDTTLYTGITKYAWDQEGKKVKIFISLEGIGQIPRENILHEFSNHSVDVKIKGYKGTNQRFAIKKTFDEIINPECSVKVTNNSVVVYLVKKENKHWDQLAYKEKLVNTDASKLDKGGDPQAALMDMMKEMYQNGDDEMKKTIAQAWTKSQEEKNKMM